MKRVFVSRHENLSNGNTNKNVVPPNIKKQRTTDDEEGEVIEEFTTSFDDRKKPVKKAVSELKFEPPPHIRRGSYGAPPTLARNHTSPPPPIPNIPPPPAIPPPPPPRNNAALLKKSSGSYEEGEISTPTSTNKYNSGNRGESWGAASSSSSSGWGGTGYKKWGNVKTSAPTNSLATNNRATTNSWTSSAIATNTGNSSKINKRWSSSNIGNWASTNNTASVSSSSTPTPASESRWGSISTASNTANTTATNAVGALTSAALGNSDAWASSSATNRRFSKEKKNLDWIGPSHVHQNNANTSSDTKPSWDTSNRLSNKYKYRGWDTGRTTHKEKEPEISFPIATRTCTNAPDWRQANSDSQSQTTVSSTASNEDNNSTSRYNSNNNRRSFLKFTPPSTVSNQLNEIAPAPTTSTFKWGSSTSAKSTRPTLQHATSAPLDFMKQKPKFANSWRSTSDVGTSSIGSSSSFFTSSKSSFEKSGFGGDNSFNENKDHFIQTEEVVKDTQEVIHPDYTVEKSHTPLHESAPPPFSMPSKPHILPPPMIPPPPPPPSVQEQHQSLTQAAKMDRSSPIMPSASQSSSTAVLGSPDKIQKAEEIILKLLQTLNIPPNFEIDNTHTLPPKAQILKGISNLDAAIQSQTDSRESLKKQIVKIEKDQEEKNKRIQKEKEQLKLSKEEFQKDMADVCKKENDVRTERCKVIIKLKEELMQLKEVEIASKEKELANMQQTITSTNQKRKEAESQPGFYLMDQPGQLYKLVQTIHKKNEFIAKGAQKQMLHSILPLSSDYIDIEKIKAIDGPLKALYSNPSEAPYFNENNQKHSKLTESMSKIISQEKKLYYDNLCLLGFEYSYRHELFQKDLPLKGMKRETLPTKEIVSTSIFNTTDNLNNSSTLSTRQQRSNLQSNPYRRARNAANNSVALSASGCQNNAHNAARSEYEAEQIISELHLREQSDNFIPPLRSLYKSQPLTSSSYIDTMNSRKIEDPMKESEDAKRLNMWTDIEKCIFLDRFLQSPKNFHNISMFLRNKSVKDCIAFYYLSKTSIPYKAALSEYWARSKRRRAGAHQSNSYDAEFGELGNGMNLWQATIQAALSVGAVIKKGNNPEKPLIFSLPSSGQELTYHTRKFHPLGASLFEDIVEEIDEGNHTAKDETKVEEPIEKTNKMQSIASPLFSLDEQQMKFLRTVSDESFHNNLGSSANRHNITMLSNLDKSKKELSENNENKSNMEPTDELKENANEKHTISSKEDPIPLKKMPHKWNAQEKKQFMETVAKYGKQWSILSNAIPTKTINQIKNYYYDHKKHFGKASLNASTTNSSTGTALPVVTSAEKNSSTSSIKKRPKSKDDNNNVPIKKVKVSKKMHGKNDMEKDKEDSPLPKKKTSYSVPTLPPPTLPSIQVSSLAQLVNAAAAVDSVNSKTNVTKKKHKNQSEQSKEHSENDLMDASLVLSSLGVTSSKNK